MVSGQLLVRRGYLVMALLEFTSYKGKSDPWSTSFDKHPGALKLPECCLHLFALAAHVRSSDRHLTGV